MLTNCSLRCFSFSVEGHDDVVMTVTRFPKTRKEVKTRMLLHQCHVVKVMLENFDRRLPMKPVVPLLTKVFSYGQMPLSNQDLLQAYGDTELTEIVRTKFPYYMPVVGEVLAQARQVRLFVSKNKSRFVRKVEEWIDEDTAEIHPESVELLLTGPGSVFELMFTQSDGFGLPVPLFAHIADFMITYRFQQSDTERTGGILTAVLTKQRTLMKDDILEALVFLAQNLPPLHLIDVDRLVNEWIRRKNLLPYNRNETIGRVLQRMYNETTTKFVLRKDEEKM